MKEFLIYINSADNSRSTRIKSLLIEEGVITKGDSVHFAFDSKLSITEPPTVRVEEVFDVEGVGVSTTINSG
jgi:hypothetical protein